MDLTPAQLTTVKNFIAADGTLNAFPSDGSGLAAIADALNLIASPDFMVWRTDVPINNILDAISWDKFTPLDAADATVIYTNRLMLIQTKQMNLQNMVVARSTIDATKANIRLGLRDAVIALPAGTAGALVTAAGVNGVTLMTALTRKSLVIEKMLVTSSPTTGTITAGIMGFEGIITPNQVDQARRSA